LFIQKNLKNKVKNWKNDDNKVLSKTTKRILLIKLLYQRRLNNNLDMKKDIKHLQDEYQTLLKAYMDLREELELIR
jgi:transcription termination factor NusB